MKVKLIVNDITTEREDAIAHQLKKMIDDQLRFLEELDKLDYEKDDLA